MPKKNRCLTAVFFHFILLVGAVIALLQTLFPESRALDAELLRVKRVMANPRFLLRFVIGKRLDGRLGHEENGENAEDVGIR